jgi:hypothetical protein
VYYPQQAAVPAPPKEPDPPWAAIILGLIGGLVALVGAVMPWISFQTCAQASVFRFCLPFGLPTGWAGVGSYNAFLPLAAPLALVLALVGLVMLFLGKPPLGLGASAAGAGAVAIAAVYIAVAGPLLPQMGADLELMDTASVSVTASIGVGVYVTMVGAVMLVLAGIIDWKLLTDAQAAKQGASAQQTAPASGAAPAVAPPAQPPQGPPGP